MSQGIIPQLLDKTKEAYMELFTRLYQFREDDLKVLCDEIERGCYKDQQAVLSEVIRLFDEKFTFQTVVDEKREKP